MLSKTRKIMKLGYNTEGQAENGENGSMNSAEEIPGFNSLKVREDFLLLLEIAKRE